MPVERRSNLELNEKHELDVETSTECVAPILRVFLVEARPK